jgi:hypothetical protein
MGVVDLAESRLTGTLASVASLQFLHPYPPAPMGLEFLRPRPPSEAGFTPASLTGFVVDAGSAKYVVSAGHFEARSHSFVGHFLHQGLSSPLTIALRQFDDARRKDVAIFCIDDRSVDARLPSAVVASDAQFSVGDEAYIVGYPCPDLLRVHYNAAEPIEVVKKGVVSARIERTGELSPLLLLDAIWDEGMSGGPVIHAATGNVIGIVSSRPVIDTHPLEFISCPSGDQILDALSLASSP